MIDLKDCTFIIPFYYDSKERLENLTCILKHLTDSYDTKIICMEESQNMQEIAWKIVDHKNIAYGSFKPKVSGYFHRTHTINTAIKISTTKYICIYDTDVIFKPIQILNAYHLLKKGISMVYPYAGNFINIERSYINDGIIIEKESFALESVGGAVFLNKEDYTRAGLENEHYISWCPDDVDRYHRMKTLGFKIERTAGNCYHIAHPASPNSGPNAYTQANNAEYEKVKNMDKNNLKKYISEWPWIR